MFNFNKLNFDLDLHENTLIYETVSIPNILIRQLVII